MRKRSRTRKRKRKRQRSTIDARGDSESVVESVTVEAAVVEANMAEPIVEAEREADVVVAFLVAVFTTVYGESSCLFSLCNAAMLQCCNAAMLQCCNAATIQSEICEITVESNNVNCFDVSNSLSR